MPIKEQIFNALRAISHPRTGRSIVDSGLVQSVAVNGSIASITLEIAPGEAEIMEPIRAACEKAALTVAGVERARAIMTASRAPAAGRQSPPAPPKPRPLPGVRHLVLVASGKGGVGKSTTAVNLAFALQGLGLKVGVIDCDVYGPSVAKMLGLHGPARFTDKDRIRPHFSNGVAAMSMGCIIDAETAAIWRGPMVISAVQQLLTGVEWNERGELDVLIADLPPGTGDVQLTLAQTAAVSGAIIVSTPQDIALIDARKAFDMFAKTQAPILGVIENMSHFTCPKCGERSEIFGHGGAEAFAAEKDVAFLGAIPLHLDIRTASDAGKPIVVSAPDSEHARIYREMARKIANSLSLQAALD